MTHPAGSVSFDPGGRFTFNRGFVSNFEWFANHDNADITFDGTTFTIGSVNFPSIVQFVEIDPVWWNWSSNSYSLDHLVVAYWYVVNPDPTEHGNSGLVVHFLWDDTLGWYIQFQKESPDTHLPFAFAQAGADYWLYPVPGE